MKPILPDVETCCNCGEASPDYSHTHGGRFVCDPCRPYFLDVFSCDDCGQEFEYTGLPVTCLCGSRAVAHRFADTDNMMKAKQEELLELEAA